MGLPSHCYSSEGCSFRAIRFCGRGGNHGMRIDRVYGNGIERSGGGCDCDCDGDCVSSRGAYLNEEIELLMLND